MNDPYRIDSLVEARIRAAVRDGEFDDLPGAGRPIPGRGEPYDENWWIRDFMRREELGDVMLPGSIRLARDVERLPGHIRTLPSEEQVRKAVAEINTRIRDYRRRPTEPFVPVREVDPERLVADWRTCATLRPATAEPEAGRPARTRRGWFRRRH